MYIYRIYFPVNDLNSVMNLNHEKQSIVLCESRQCTQQCSYVYMNPFSWGCRIYRLYIYIYILPSTDRLFRCIKTLQCG